MFCRNDDVTVQLMMGYRKGKRVMKRMVPMLSDVRIITFKSPLQTWLLTVNNYFAALCDFIGACPGCVAGSHSKPVNNHEDSTDQVSV